MAGNGAGNVMKALSLDIEEIASKVTSVDGLTS